jgi:4-aminobutyrate aminotransferase-like enzyme
VFSEHGFPFLDFGPGAAANVLGHSHPTVVMRIQEHLSHYTFTGTDHLARFSIEYASALAQAVGEDYQALVVPSIRDARWIAHLMPGITDDETKTGFGRTGKLWGFQHDGTKPDIVILGPGGGGGLPFAAVVARTAMFTPDVRREIPMMAAHPVVCVAAAAVLEHLQPELLSHVVEMGRVLTEGLGQLHAQFPEHIAPPHQSGVGLLQCLPITDKVDAQKFRAALMHGGLLTHPDLTLTPPLTITEQEVRQAIDVIADACL